MRNYNIDRLGTFFMESACRQHKSGASIDHVINQYRYLKL